ncbi:hypothetical protein CI109_100479 [Kwoniella shandongensis]|uniref:Uncharacterized protein n=1 Tax=Kwoniella shandongensis TaxID=1734106 RepID=A0A5M6C968_9TREE|nr:uncharacterized protein CI109_001678 [Kwoniella shandongensis]KAA5529739.1 hypothetical protein CI109_001678 [Kwoniella shandongensis]
MSFVNALLYSDDILAVPMRLIHTLSRNGNVESLVPLAIRALVIGWLFALLRRFTKYATTQLGRTFFPTAYISISDPAYNWITAWIAQDAKAQSQIHDFQLVTEEWRSAKKKNAATIQATAGTNVLATTGVGAAVGAVGASGKETLARSASWSWKGIIGQVLPTYNHRIRLKHDGNYIWVTRRINGFARGRIIEHYQVRTIAFQSNVLRNFLVAAHKAYYAKEERELLIFHTKRINATWLRPVSRPSRPWSSVILPNSIKETILTDMEKFLSDTEIRWYASRGIPHRRGYLFHGEPGAGKTTLVTALASKLALDIYVINPAQRGMDDAKLAKLFRDCPSKSIILIEDIDCIFPHGRSQAINTGSTAIQNNDEQEEISVEPITESPPDMSEVSSSTQVAVGGTHDLSPSVVTMSGLLNAIDGVSSQEGCVLIATTNHLDRLDPALSRAGRFDIRIPFSTALPSQARALYLHFYPLEDFQSFPSNDEKQPAIKTQTDIEDLADRFVLAVFGHDSDDKHHQAVKFEDLEGTKDRKQNGLSMASLQGYLLKHKDDPVGAVEHAQEWMMDGSEQQKGRRKGKA